MENHSLIKRIKNKGGDDALKEIYGNYRDEFLLWAVRHHSCTMEEAKDIFQQSVVIFYENIMVGKVKEITTRVKTYLFSIGKYKIYELVRQKSKHSLQVDDPVYVNSDIFYNDIDDEYEEKLKKVENCMTKLGDPCKNILEHYYYHKKSMQEISEIMDYKGSETVKNLKYKCLQRLKKIINSGFGTINE